MSLPVVEQDLGGKEGGIERVDEAAEDSAVRQLAQFLEQKRAASSVLTAAETKLNLVVCCLFCVAK